MIARERLKGSWGASLLLVVPGIVATYRYSMACDILVDRPEMGAKEALDRSRSRMAGLKMRLFRLDLSFVGWALLCILPPGIGFPWLVPCASLSQARFFEAFIRDRVDPEPVPAPEAGTTTPGVPAQTGAEDGSSPWGP